MARISRPRIWRRTFIVDRRFQYEMMIRAGVYAILGMMVLCVGIFYPLIRDLLSGKENMDASTAMIYLHDHFWPIAVLCVVLALLTSIHITHRIAGPLYRIKVQLASLGDGVIPGEAITRKRDYLKDEVLVLNQTMASLTQATDRIKAEEEILRRELRGCADMLGDYGNEDLRQSFARLEQKAQRLHESIAHFRSPGAGPIVDGNDSDLQARSHSMMS